jgi:diketogulonate reductase-like aldo/keto reductase
MLITQTREVRGVSVPSIMYGTAWKEDRTEALTLQAIASGFRAIDTANQRKHYVESAVGAAVAAVLEEGHIARESLFLQTKFTYPAGQDHRLPYDPDADLATQVGQSIESSLEHLGVSRLDSYILHAPSSAVGFGETDWQTWRAMEQAVRAGRVGMLGISNISVEQLATLLDGASITPAFVQNRCLAHERWDAEVRTLCQAHDIVYQAFSLLPGNRHVLSSPLVSALARLHGKTPCQVVLRFATQLGMLPLNGTTSTRHMQQNLDVFDFVLVDEDIQLMLEVGGLA